MIKEKFWVFLLCVFLIFSCKQDTNIATYTVQYSDFNNSLMIEGFVEPVLSTTLSSPRSCDGTIEFLIDDGVTVEEGEVVCIIEYQALQNEYDQITIALENAEVGLIKTQADLNMQYALLEAQVRTNDADTRIAQMDSLQIAFMSMTQRSIKELELERATIEKARYEKKIEALKVIQQSEIKKLELEIQRFRNRVETMKEQLDALTLKAPKSGLVILANNPLTGTKVKVGDPVWSNFPIATLPQFEQMKVMIMASETDFKSININDSVSYTFDAMPGNTGTGKILKKSPIGQPYKRGSTVKFFEIEASIDSVPTMPEPGFKANCKVVLKQVENVISIPQIAIFDEDSIKIVFVKRKKRYEKRQILTDVSSTKETVISAGLKENEVIALSKPKLSLVKELIALPDSITKKSNPTVDSLKQENMYSFPPVWVPNILQRKD